MVRRGRLQEQGLRFGLLGLVAGSCQNNESMSWDRIENYTLELIFCVSSINSGKFSILFLSW